MQILKETVHQSFSLSKNVIVVVRLSLLSVFLTFAGLFLRGEVAILPLGHGSSVTLVKLSLTLFGYAALHVFVCGVAARLVIAFKTSLVWNFLALTNNKQMTHNI